MVHAVQHVLWCQLYTLVVGGLLLFLILQFYTYSFIRISEMSYGILVLFSIEKSIKK